MSVAPARRQAWRILTRVQGGAPLDPQLEAALAREPEARSRAFLAELVKGTLRWQGRYDHLIGRLSRRRAPRDARLLCLLRLSLHQLIALHGVPDYAVLHQAGELCRQEVSPRLVGYVNGLLQATVRRLRAAPTPAAALAPLFPPPDTDPVGHLSAWHSHPRWLVARWLRRWGPAAAEALCRHDNEPPPLCLHVLPPADPAATAAALAAAGLDVEAGRHHDRALRVRERLERDRLEALLAARPELIVQDEGAQLVCEFLAADPPDGALLDMCAAPGGKTVDLAARRRPGAPGPLVAADVAPARLRLVRDATRRTGLAADLVAADGAAPPFAAGRFAAVLLDGPCSGTGVLRHHPEGRWRLQERDLPRRRARLLTLGRRAATLLAAGGLLLYATCSLEPEENEEVVAALLADGLLEPAPPGGGPPAAARRAWLPQETGTDGFFAARLRRKGNR